jgi:hypothetical protein
VHIEVSGELLGSVKGIYQGAQTDGRNFKFKTVGAFMELLPEADRLAGYRLFLACIAAVPKGDAMVAALERGYFLEVSFAQFKSVEPDRNKVPSIYSPDGGVSLYFEGVDKINPNLSSLWAPEFNLYRPADWNAYNALTAHIKANLLSEDLLSAFAVGRGLGNLRNLNHAGPFGLPTDQRFNLERGLVASNAKGIGLRQDLNQVPRDEMRSASGSGLVLHAVEAELRERINHQSQ